MRIVHIYGPPGSGKTRNAKALAKHYRCKNVIDDGEYTEAGLRQAASDGGVLILSVNESRDRISIPIAAALRAIGVSPSDPSCRVNDVRKAGLADKKRK